MSDFKETSLHEELEVRVIALLTGELSEAEADELEQILAINTELSAFRDRMAELMGELHQSSDELAESQGESPRQLSEDRRARIFGDASVLKPKAKRKRFWMNPALWGVAASITMVFSIGLLGTVKFVSEAMRKETVFEAAPLAPLPQSEPEYMVNLEQHNLAAPSARPPAITVNNPSNLDIPALDIDVQTDSSSVYGRGGGGFGDGLLELRQESSVYSLDAISVEDFSRFSERDVADSIKEARLGEAIPVDIPAGRIEGTPMQIQVPNLEPAPTQAPRMVVADSKLGIDDNASDKDAELGAAVREMKTEFSAFGYSKQVSEDEHLKPELAKASSRLRSNIDPFAAPVVKDEDQQILSDVASAPVDAFAAPKPTPLSSRGQSMEKSDVEMAELFKKGRRDFLNGDYDAAAVAFDGIEAIDPDNAEAKLFTNRIDSIQSTTSEVASQKAMLTEVDMAWERPKVFASGISGGVVPRRRVVTDVQEAGRSEKLSSIVIPQVNFSGMPMSKVVETLSELSAVYDPEQKGVPIEYEPVDGIDPKVNISLRNLDLDRILQFVTQQVNFSYDVGDETIKVQPSVSLGSVATTQTAYIPISREVMLRLMGEREVNSAGSVTNELQGFFQSAGVNNELPDSSLTFDGEQLIVTNTPRNLERIRTIVRHYEEKQKAEEAAQSVSLTPKPEKLSAEEPFSTFSLNISDVSFKLAQAALQNSRVPPSAQIRTEEFVNSFDYGDPEPRPDEPVTLNWEIAQHPFEHDRQVVRFSVQTGASGRAAGQPLNISLLVDNSGSMQRTDRQAILQNSLETLEEKLTPKDKLNVILFARQPRLIAEAKTRESQKLAVENALAYRPEGGTNLEAGLQAAYETAQRNYLPNGSNRVILMTDGAANLGNVNAGELAELVVEQRKQGIALDAYGIGWDDYNDALLEEITRNGDGRYAFLNSVEDASEDFSEKLAGTLRVAAANVKVQVEWNPERVTRYRQIGYDLHQLKKEDFRDNTVDAAEIGEAEAGTALYVLQIDDDPEIVGGLGTLHVRYLDPATGLYREQSWPLSMPRSVPAAAAASPSMRLALSSALFGERLANSPFASGYDLSDLYAMTAGLPEAFPNQPRVAEMQTMLLQASELYGEK